MNSPSLPAPARYFPVDVGPYRIAAGLRKLGTDFGNGPADANVIQFDNQFHQYHSNKLKARAERLSKYFVKHQLSQEVETAACSQLIQLFTSEHPQLFTLKHINKSTVTLYCNLTGDLLCFEQGQYSSSRSQTQTVPAYLGGIDALACQMQEDLAVTCRNDGQDWLAAAHLCAPGHWSPEEKIGKNFAAIHAPIPGIKPIIKTADSLLRSMIERSPMVRFVWGFGTDTRLNHHPEPPPEIDPVRWKGRAFAKSAAAESPFFLRVERQVLYGLPDVNASLFFIRVYHLNGLEIRANESERTTLINALTTMGPETRRYKGLTESLQPLISWLQS